MFFNRISLFNISCAPKKPDMLPVDFGAMYYLYPSENQYSGFEVSSYAEKLLDRVRTCFKKDNEAAFHKNDFFC